MSSLLVIALVLLVSNTAGLQIDFGENDYSERESAASIEVGVAKFEENIGNIVVSVIPLTVEQYKERFDFETLPESLKSIVEETDPAEASDFRSEIHNITFAPTSGFQEQMIAIEVTDDGTEEPEEVFLVYLEIVHISDGDEENLEPATRVTVAKIRLDNDIRLEVTIGFTEELLEIPEGEAADVCVRLEPVGDVEISLRVYTHPGNATADEHYVHISQDLSLSSVISMDCVTMVTIQNNVAELPRVFTVRLEDKNPVTLHHLEPSSATVVITDDDGLQIGFRQTDYVANELGQLVLEVTKIGKNSGSITVRVTPVTIEDYSNSETLPNAVKNTIDTKDPAEVSDFSGDSHDITFPVGGNDDTRQVTIELVDDSIHEPEEVFLVFLEVLQANDQDAGNVALPESVSVGRIQDDDSVSISFNRTVVSLSEDSTSFSVDIVRTGVTAIVLEIDLDVSSDSSATIGSDFEVAQTSFALEPSATQIQVAFSIMDDIIPEQNETFTVNIRSSSDFNIGGSLTVEIVDNDAVIVGLTNGAHVVEVEEGGMFETCAAIMNPDVDVELNLHIFTVPGNASVDHYMTFSHHLSLDNGKKTECFTVETVGNSKAELPSTFTIMLEDTNPHILHRVQPNSVTVVITDDDIIRIGFTLSQTQSVQEGNSIDVCVTILEPKEVEIEIKLSVLVQGNASEVEHYEPFVQELIVSGVTWSDCITIATIENNKIELPHALTMTLQGSTQHLNLTPNSITVIITDDDGVPELPRGIKIDLVNDNKDLLIQWEVPKSELRPVNSFLVIVNKLDTRRQSNEEIYETQQTNFTLMDINLNTKYVIQICAKNTLGDSCSDEVTFSSFIPPITQGLPRNEEESGLDVPGFVLILLALPVLVSLLCCFMMLIVFWVCCRPSESRKYYPREEEHRHKEEYVLSLQDIYMSSLSPSATDIDSNLRTLV